MLELRFDGAMPFVEALLAVQIGCIALLVVLVTIDAIRSRTTRRYARNNSNFVAAKGHARPAA